MLWSKLGNNVLRSPLFVLAGSCYGNTGAAWHWSNTLHYVRLITCTPTLKHSTIHFFVQYQSLRSSAPAYYSYSFVFLVCLSFLAILHFVFGHIHTYINKQTKETDANKCNIRIHVALLYFPWSSFCFRLINFWYSFLTVVLNVAQSCNLTANFWSISS